ncbi:hypothetical protein N431DRAFT_458766 [Stipitochalara longipes BDJ]|nr:hypothetical protein N431DRAFT_458766 [Stipitochalara longipes BDJ]
MATSTILASPALDFLDGMYTGLDLVDYPGNSYEKWNENHAKNISTRHLDVCLPSNTSPGYLTPELTFKCEVNESKVGRLERRREQNRTSQQKFRERNKKAYEVVVQALKAEKQVSAHLRDEIAALKSVVECLKRENQTLWRRSQSSATWDLDL